MASAVRWVEEYNLIQKILAGDNYRYIGLVKRYQRYIFSLMCQITNSQGAAEALTRQLFVKAYQDLRKFKFKTSFYIWLYRRALDMGVRFMEGRSTAVPKDSLYTPFVPEEGVEYSAEELQHIDADFREPVRRAFALLSRKQRKIIILKYYVELNYDQINEIMGLPELGGKSVVYKGRMVLRKKLIRWGFLS